MSRSEKSKGILPPVMCKAHSSRTGEPCKKYAIVGGAVCNTHGGSSPHVKEAAKKRLAALVDDALYGIEKLAGVGGHGLSAENENVRLRALQDLLDRAGMKPSDKLEVSGEAIPNDELDEAIMRALERRAKEK